MLRVPAACQSKRPMEVNLTSMVDIVFLLIIFFMLVSSYISAENVEVDLPKPDRSIAESLELPERIVLNCRSTRRADGSQGIRYQLGVQRVDTTADLAAGLRAIADERPQTELVLRADRTLPYASIREALEAVAEAGIASVHIAAEVED